MMKPQTPFSFSHLIPLGIAVALTLHAQSSWMPIESNLGIPIAVFWLVLMVGWLIRVLQSKFFERRFSRRLTILPLCLLFLGICEVSHAPLRLVFALQKPALKEALKHPILGRQRGYEGQKIGGWQPLQISKSGAATRFIFAQHDAFLDGTAVGFMFAPKATKFEWFWLDSQSDPKLLDLGDGWFAVRLHGSDW